MHKRIHQIDMYYYVAVLFLVDAANSKVMVHFFKLWFRCFVHGDQNSRFLGKVILCAMNNPTSPSLLACSSIGRERNCGFFHLCNMATDKKTPNGSREKWF